MNSINQFFLDLILKLQIPRDHHYIKWRYLNDILTILVECDTIDPSINKLLSEFMNNFNFYIDGLLGVLRDEYPDFNFDFHDIKSDLVRVNLEISVYKSFLNLRNIPADIFKVIIPYLDLQTYYMLISFLRVERYPEIEKYLFNIDTIRSLSY